MTNRDELRKLEQELTAVTIREREAGIKHAAEMLDRDAQRDQVRALLHKVARNDPATIVREAAQLALDDDERQTTPRLSRQDEARHIFGARCPKGHVTYFDKRIVCPATSTVMRSLVRRDGKELDRLSLKCEQCGDKLTVEVDCEGYK